MIRNKYLAAIVVAGVMLGAAGCQKKDDVAANGPGPGPAEQAGRKLDQATDKAGRELTRAAEDANRKISDAAKDTSDKLNKAAGDAGEKINQATVEAGKKVEQAGEKMQAAGHEREASRDK